MKIKNYLKAAAAIFLALSMISGGMINSYALRYGEEWENETDSQGRPLRAKPGELIPTIAFNDVPETHWAFESIVYCRSRNWFEGYEDNTFEPDAIITRAEAIKVIDMYCGLPINLQAVSTFTDVRSDAWYRPYIEAGKHLFPYRTSLQGVSKIAPEEPITREDAVYLLVNALNYERYVDKADYSVLRQFKDESNITYDNRPYLAVAVKYGIIAGHDDGTFGPKDPLKRSEFASLLHHGELSKKDI